MSSRIFIITLLALILGVPFLMRPKQASNTDAQGSMPPTAARTLVVVTPHVPQIQYEFAIAFDEWHKRKYGENVRIDWRQPGGTSDILKQLGSQYASRCGELVRKYRATQPGRLLAPTLDLSDEFPAGSAAFDVMMGGGSFDHGRLKDTATAAYWFRPFEGLGTQTVLVRAKSPVQAAVIQNERQVLALVTRKTQPKATSQDGVSQAEILVRIPVAAFAGGAQAIEQLASQSAAKATEPIELLLNLDLIERQATVPISIPLGWEPARLAAIFGENKLGSGTLYDPDQYWIGTAISGFGIVYNRDVLERLGINPPESFEDLANPKLQGWVVFADPRQSGSVATSIDALLSYYGWEKGWRILREMCANTRYYTNSAPRPPIDVSQGEAAMALAIDFYGRNQAQATLKSGQDPLTSRVGYVDPIGATYMDADPISILRGGPSPELARRFVEFCLTIEGQALWQFPAAIHEASKSNPTGSDGELLGPKRNELRRMPVLRSMYETYLPHMIDKANPFQLASTTKPAGWRGTIGMMMGAFAIDISKEQYVAWRALIAARAQLGFPKDRLEEMERLFYAFPETTMPDGKRLSFVPENVRALTSAWKDATFKNRCEIAYTEFYRANYRQVLRLWQDRPS